MSTGHLSVVGIGPGAAEQLTGEAQAELDKAEVLYGYGPYLARLELAAHQHAVPSDNRVEAQRARHALEDAASGKRVALVSGGDPGVFAMAAAVCEEVEAGPSSYRQVTLAVVPGVTAMLAAAAACGAPLGHDFCCLSLSDNLKPWQLIERRLRAAAGCGLALALYNPISKARPWQLGRAFDVLREQLPTHTPVIFARAVTRPDQQIRIARLGDARAGWADMATMVIVGSAATRVVERSGQSTLVYTPRHA